MHSHSISRSLAFPRRGVGELGERFPHDASIGSDYNTPAFETVREGFFLLTTGLRKPLRRDRIRVHCEHRQAVRDLAPGFKAVASSRGGVIEAIESSSSRIMAVQWHPERTLESPASQRQFRRFIRRAARYRSE